MDEKVFKDTPGEQITYYFSIKYRGTEENKRVHEAFKEFSRVHTEGNYLQAINKLLEQSTMDWKYELLFEELQLLKERVALLESQSQPKEQNNVQRLKTFG